MPKDNSTAKANMQKCCNCNEPFDLETGFFKTNSEIYRGTQTTFKRKA